MKNAFFSHKNTLILSSILLLGGAVLGILASDLNVGLRTQSLANNFSVIHFNSAGNNFGGGTFWVSTETNLDTPMIIQSPSGEKITCSTQIQGYYYNSQRGERLWPLDNNSLESLKGLGNNYDNLIVKGGFYTNCNEDSYGIYGKIWHNLNGENFELVAGLNYDGGKNKIIENSDLSCNLQLINNRTTIGYLYDKSGGIGFVGGQIPSDTTNNNLLSYLGNEHCITNYCSMDSTDRVVCSVDQEKWIAQNSHSFQNLKRSIAVRGVIGLTQDLLIEDKENILGNFGEKTYTVSTDSLSIAHSINTAALQAEKICRQNWVKELKPGDLTKHVICYDGNDTIKINPSTWGGKVLVVKHANVFIANYMQQGDQPFSLFIDGGNLVIPGTIATGDLIGFDDTGYPNIASFVNKGNYLKGTFIINGLLLSKDNTTDTLYTGVSNKLYLHGKLLSFNTYDDPSLTRKNLMNSILSQETTASNYQHYISFRDLFLRRCQDNGYGTDMTDCSQGVSEFARASLVLIDEDFNSLLLK